MKKYEIIIPGKPYPLKRHRVVGKIHYDPQSKLKANLQRYIQTLENTPKRLESPLFITMVFNMPIPKSYSKKRALERVGQPHTSKPDLTNLAKFYEDAFNGIFWKDDAIIASMLLTKVYANVASTIITVEEYTSNKMHSLLSVSTPRGGF